MQLNQSDRELDLVNAATEVSENLSNQAPPIPEVAIPQLDSLDNTIGNNPEFISPKHSISSEVQEQFRGRTVVLILVIYLGVTTFGIGIYIQLNPDPERNIQLLTMVWTSLVTLVSGALGFYFGNSKR